MIYDIIMLQNYTHKLWEEFADEVIRKNDFPVESELLVKIKEISEYAECVIEEGTLLYRSREYTQDDFMRNARVKKISEQQAPFWGFDKKNCDAPPSRLAKEGRANAKGISYLYTTMDIETAILEMRPQMRKMYNIATIKVKKNGRIFDFTFLPDRPKEGEYINFLDLHKLSEEFSKPNFGDKQEYLPTQCLCEYIRRLGFDGIKFKSAVSAHGYNILFFDTDEETRMYDITQSKVYRVNSLDIHISQVLPVEE